MQRTINPDAGVLSQLSRQAKEDQPVVMLNLLRFADTANYCDGEFSGSGRDAYARYTEHAFGKVKAAGGSVVYHGRNMFGVITPEEERWDELLLVEYPSVNAFIGMVMDPDYQKITFHRTAALDDSRLWMSVKN